MNDSDKTAILRELVRGRHIVEPDGFTRADVAGRWLVLDEVRNGTGAIADRYADCVAVALWPTDGLDIIGYELKASRADLKRELDNPTKAAQTGGWMDEWWLVAWSERMLEGFTLPAEWGIAVRVTGKHDDDHDLRVVRKATRRVRDEESIRRGRVTALLRAASRASFGAWYTGEAIRIASRRSFHAGQEQGRSDAEREVQKLLRPFRATMKLKYSWDEPSAADLCARAVELLAASAAPSGDADRG